MRDLNDLIVNRGEMRADEARAINNNFEILVHVSGDEDVPEQILVYKLSPVVEEP